MLAAAAAHHPKPLSVRLYRWYRITYALLTAAAWITSVPLYYGLQSMSDRGGSSAGTCAGLVFCGRLPLPMCIGSKPKNAGVGDVLYTEQGVVSGVTQYSVDCEVSSSLCDMERYTAPSTNASALPPGRCAGVCASIELVDAAPYVVPLVSSDDAHQITNPYAVCACPFDRNRFLHCREHAALKLASQLDLSGFVFCLVFSILIGVSSLFATDSHLMLAVLQRAPCYFCCCTCGGEADDIDAPQPYDRYRNRSHDCCCACPNDGRGGSHTDRRLYRQLQAPHHALVVDVVVFGSCELLQLVSAAYAWNYFEWSTDLSAAAVTRRGLELDRVVCGTLCLTFFFLFRI
jgi:hypothetical protein